MNRYTRIWYRVRDLTKIIYSTLSICFILGILYLLVFWLLSSDYYYQLRPWREEHISIADNDGTKVFETSLLIVGSGRAQYQQWIEDIKGHVVHEYQPYEARATTNSNVRFGGISIPKGLPPGKYTVKARLFYQANPIRTSELSFELGTFTIETDKHPD